MVIELDAELVAALNDMARRLEVSPQDLALNVLRARLRYLASPIEPRDEWERGLLAIASPCGVSLSNEAVSSEGIYE